MPAPAPITLPDAAQNRADAASHQLDPGAFPTLPESASAVQSSLPDPALTDHGPDGVASGEAGQAAVPGDPGTFPTLPDASGDAGLSLAQQQADYLAAGAGAGGTTGFAGDSQWLDYIEQDLPESAAAQAHDALLNAAAPQADLGASTALPDAAAGGLETAQAVAHHDLFG